MPFPTDAVIVHPGPDRRTAARLQSALHASRAGGVGQGLVYAGRHREPLRAALAALRAPSPYPSAKGSDDDGTAERDDLVGKRRLERQAKLEARGVVLANAWDQLAAEVRSRREVRVAISSAALAQADHARIREMVADLGILRSHAFLTVRPLAGALAHEWQAAVMDGAALAYEDWLRAILKPGSGPMARAFWKRYGYERLVERWAWVVGADRVTVSIVDDARPDEPLRQLEELAELRPGTLQPEPDLVDRALTAPEAEVIRTINVAWRAEGLGTRMHASLIRHGAVSEILGRVPVPDEPPIRTPSWAVEAAMAFARQATEGIDDAAVKVLGDLESLAAPVGEGSGASGEPEASGVSVAAEVDPESWADIGSRAAVGILIASGLAPGSEARRAALPWPDGPIPPVTPPVRAKVEPIELARVSTPALTGVFLRRLAAEAATRVRVRLRAS